MPGNRNIRRFEETMARQIGLGMLLLALITLLSGCMYRGEQQAGPVSYMDSVDRVQRALDRFQEREDSPDHHRRGGDAAVREVPDRPGPPEAVGISR